MHSDIIGMETTEGHPYVICYVAVSLDGRLDGFEVDLERYYGIAARFEVDAILSGSETSVVARLFLGMPARGTSPGPTARRSGATSATTT
jgi:hypothetical protein